MKLYRGFSLIQVMVVLAIMGAGTVGLMELTNLNSKSSKTIETRYEMFEILVQINGMLADPSACEENFLGLSAVNDVATFTSGSPNTLKYASGQSSKFLVGSSFQSGLKLKSMQLKGTESVNAGNGMRVVPLIIKFERPKKSLSSKDLVKKIDLRVSVDGSNNISSCISTVGVSNTNTTGSIWRKNPNDLNEIFYSGGNVGINISDPKQVLDVQGAVKIGVAGGPCNANTEGSIRYNTAQKKMQFCNGTSWAFIYPNTAPSAPRFECYTASVNLTGNSWGSCCKVATARCRSGYKMTGGGCTAGWEFKVQGWPAGNGYSCAKVANGANGSGSKAYARCCRVR